MAVLNKFPNENNLITKTKIIRLTKSRCNSAFLHPRDISLEEDNNN